MARTIAWDIYEEHFSEAAWLWGEWAESLSSPLYCLGEVAEGPEERLLAHLDGLVLGGVPVAKKLLLPALESEEVGEVTTAAWALLQAEDADHQDAVIEKLSSVAPPGQAAIWRALSLSPRADISRLLQHWHEGSPAARATILDIFTRREPDWANQQVYDAFNAGQPELIAAVLRTIRTLRKREHAEVVRMALAHPSPSVQQEAMTTGLSLGLKETWSLCRSLARAQGPNCRLALGLLAVSTDGKDRAMVAEAMAVPELREYAVWALGFCADAKAVDLLVQAMADPELTKLAGEAFTAVTGAPIEGALAKVGEPVPPDVVEVKDDDSVPVVLAVDFLREPKVEAVTKWWSKERSKYPAHIRFIQGQPRMTEAVRASLLTTSTWRREVLWTELAASVVDPPKCDLWDWARNQVKQLTQIRPVVVDRKMPATHMQTLHR